MQSGFMRPLSSIITIAVRYACRKARTFGVSVVGGTEDVPDTGTSEIMCPAVYTILLRLMRAVLRAFLPG